MTEREITAYFQKEFSKWVQYVAHETGKSEEEVIDSFLSGVAESLVRELGEDNG